MFYQATFFEIIRWTLNKKTITRALMNVGLKNFNDLDGITVDLGGGGRSSYKDIIHFHGEYINIDASIDTKPTIVANIENNLILPNSFADNILLLNVLEHIYDYNSLIEELRRIVKPNGRVIIYVPFLMPFHTHKTSNFYIDDFFRFTESSLKKIFNQHDFSNVEINPVGGLFLVIANFGSYALKFRILQVPFVAICFFMEKLYKFFKPNSAIKYPIGYFLEAKP